MGAGADLPNLPSIFTLLPGPSNQSNKSPIPERFLQPTEAGKGDESGGAEGARAGAGNFARAIIELFSISREFVLLAVAAAPVPGKEILVIVAGARSQEPGARSQGKGARSQDKGGQEPGDGGLGD